MQDFRFLGRSEMEWDAIDTVLRDYLIKDGKQLRQVLAAKAPKPVAEKRLNVVDSRNHERILGSIPQPHVPHPGAGLVITFPCMPLRCVTSGPDLSIPETSFRTVNMTIERRHLDAWTTVPYLATSTPLEDLTLVEDFRLPGETRQEAEMRRVERAYHA